jgi:hypothetical protein
LGSAIDAAFVAFWMTPQIFFASPVVTGVVSLAPPGVLISQFIDLFASGVKDRGAAEQQGAGMASIPDTLTHTVLVVNTPPGPPPVPLA